MHQLPLSNVSTTNYFTLHSQSVLAALEIEETPWTAGEVLVPVGHPPLHLAHLLVRPVAGLVVVHNLWVLCRVVADLGRGAVGEDVLLKVRGGSTN